jgi:predicted Zn-dependent peptidase
MKTINIAGIEEKMYYENLPNGLKVYLFPMANRQQTTACLMTKFGAKDTEFVPYNDDKMIHINEGVAHFLEHRLCTDKNGKDLFDFYAKSGAHFNASTSPYRTRYYFECTKDFIPNLVHLLDSIQDATFRVDDIEKEKGIIEQEIKRDMNNVYRNMYKASMKNTFSNNPIHNTTLGSIDDIKSVNKEILELCYNTFYQPSNMYLIITGNFNLDEVINTIRNNQSTKLFQSEHEIILKEYDEPDVVNNSYQELLFPVDSPKLRLIIKISIVNLKKIKDYDLYLNVIFHNKFGVTSIINERIKQKRYESYNLGLDFDEIGNHFIVTIAAEGNYLDEIICEVKKELQDLDTNEEDLQRFKKIYISIIII